MQEQRKKLLVQRLVELMEQFSAQMRSRSPTDWDDLDLTMPQVRTLFLLAQGPARMSVISAYLSRGMPTVTGVIGRLVKKGLVERIEDGSDRRVVACRLTPPGTAVVERFWRMGRMRSEALAQALTVEELEAVLPALAILSEATSRL